MKPTVQIVARVDQARDVLAAIVAALETSHATPSHDESPETGAREDQP